MNTYSFSISRFVLPIVGIEKTRRLVAVIVRQQTFKGFGKKSRRAHTIHCKQCLLRAR